MQFINQPQKQLRQFILKSFCVLTILLVHNTMYAGIEVIKIFPQEKGITLSLQNKEIKEAIATIESVSEYLFIQSGLEKTDVTKKVNIQIKEGNIEQVMALLLKDTPIRYRIIERQIILYKEKSNSQSEGVINSFIQKLFSVNGTIKDIGGIPVVGATLVLKNNTSKWAITDFDGNFTAVRCS